MSQVTLEERAAALERQVARLSLKDKNSSTTKDWRRTIGMFSGDEVMKRIEEAGRKIRQADRRRGGNSSRKPRRAKP